jgi:hypothetical protein
VTNDDRNEHQHDFPSQIGSHSVQADNITYERMMIGEWSVIYCTPRDFRGREINGLDFL